MTSTSMPTPQQISEALTQLGNTNLQTAAAQLFKLLGYHSDRVLNIQNLSQLKQQLDINNYLNQETAQTDHWRSVHWLFQLTDEEISQSTQGKLNLLDPSPYDAKQIHSYLFFAIDLDCAATKPMLVQITRALNRIVPMPILVLFRHGSKVSPKVSIAVVNRRRNLRDESKQVLTAVSLIRDIDCTQPHRAHVLLLEKLALSTIENAAAQTKTTIKGFSDLDAAWQKTLSTEALNKQFYNDLSAWFAWARTEIKLVFYPPGTPEGNSAEAQKNRQTARDEFLVRLVCRLMFAWFLKEKSLIPQALLELHNLLDEPVHQTLAADELEHDRADGNHYYRGILQNIFFKALNTPQASRSKRASTESQFLGRSYLPADFDYSQFDSIPYLNGGLFEQQPEDNYYDSIEDPVIRVPNKLFYAKLTDGYTVTQGTGRSASKPVQGLNRIFSQYIFTVSENTSLDEDVALDPELLGLVFENLLAEIDPNLEESARTSIRKQSGSYYTPKRVVQYMVNESLYLYLKTTLPQSANTNSLLTALCFQPHHSTQAETTRYAPIAEQVVDSLDALRTLDPACGSGAFPMGMLHRMVELLRIVDPGNERWKRKLIDQFPPETRAAVEADLIGKSYDYQRKLGIIRRSLYGVDIQPLAALIAKLRFFLSLIIEQTPTDNAANNYGLTPLPNLETNLLCANTLNDVQIDLLSAAGLDDYLRAREQFFQPNLTIAQREVIATQISEQLADWFPSFSQDALGVVRPPDAYTAHQQNTEQLKRWFRTAALPAPFFSAQAFFPEVMQPSTGRVQGFHIVIGNPPYGGTKIPDAVKNALSLGSKDPYGAFIARFLNDGATGRPQSPLAAGGVLAMIVSDTFMTIKSHKPLREHLLAHRIHKLLRVHPDTFNATVNTAIVLAQQGAAPPEHALQVADFTNVSIHTDYARFSYLLRQTEGTGFAHRLAVSNPQYAIYHYRQSLIRSNTNKPFFAASPKLFELMNDTGAATPQMIAGQQAYVRTVRMNGAEIQLVKLGDIAQVKVGLQTGDNHSYLYQEPQARGNYRSIDALRHCVLTAADLTAIRNDDAVRSSVVEQGISLSDTTSPRYFGGRFIAPYDKGGESDAAEGWLPNYWVPTEYYIDWGEAAVGHLMARTKIVPSSSIPVVRNPDYYFSEGVSFSDTGVYAPTFRLGGSAVFDVMGMSVFINSDLNQLCGLLGSRLIRFNVKNFVNATVHTQADGLKALTVTNHLMSRGTIANLVSSVVQKQQTNPRYDYASNEQLDIDRLVYAAYGLNDDDIREVEHWYARRYPKLAGAQRQALVAAGKTPQLTTQVLHWYGDESRHLPYDRAPIMLLGGLACPADKVATAHAELAALWAAHGLPAHFEAKWTKVSPAKLDFYIALVDWFFTSEALSEHLSLRVLVVPDKQAVFAKLPATTQDMAYYRLYYYLLHGVMAPQTQLRVFIDIKDTRGRSKTAQLLQSLQDDAGEAAMMGDVQEVHSHEVRLLQLADLLIGAIGYARIQAQGEGAALVNGAAVAVDKTMFSKPSKSGAVEQVLSSPAKRALISRIEQYLAHPLSLDTPPGNPRMTVLSWYDMDALTA